MSHVRFQERSKVSTGVDACSHISGMLREVTCDEGAWSPELPETAPWLHAQDGGLCSGLLAAVS